jgi:serine/threonine protein kinase
MKKKVGEYIIEELIGSGAYGEVYKGTSVKAPGESFAIKMISKKNMSEKVFHYLEREVEILQMMNHKNVVKLKDIKATDNHYYLIFEYCNGEDLSAFRKSKGGVLPEATVRYVLRQIVEGLNELYNKKAIHRDIKLSNVLLCYPNEEARTKEEPIIKLGDFGFARLMTQLEGDEKSISDAMEPMSFVGTPLNMAPELFHKELYSFKADIWSLGTIVYELICGRNCYTGRNKDDLIQNIDKSLYRIPKLLKLSSECMDLLNACLQFKPETRAKWKEVLNHPFISSNTFTEFDAKKFKLVNKIAADTLEESDNYVFCSMVRYNFFDSTNGSVKLKEEEEKLLEKVEKLNIEEEAEIIGRSGDLAEAEFIKVEKPIEAVELTREATGDFTIITTDKINIEEDHFA